MYLGKVVFVGIKGVENQSINHLNFNEAETISDWLKSLDKSKVKYISAAIDLCISFGLKLQSIMKGEIFLLDFLSNSPSRVSAEFEEITKIPPEIIKGNIWNLIKALAKNNELGVVILDETVFQTFGLASHHRNLGVFCFHEIILKNKTDIFTIRQLKNEISSIIEEHGKSRQTEIAEEFLLVNSKLLKIPQELKRISESINRGFKDSQKELLGVITKRSSESKSLLEKLTVLQRSLSYYKEIINLYVLSEQCPPSHSVIIKSLNFDLKQSKYRVKLVNDSEKTFKKVRILTDKNSDEKSNIQLLQAFSTVWLDIKINDNSFHNHLVVVSGDSIISEPFTLFPLNISVKNTRKNERFTLCLENLLNEPMSSLQIVSPSSISSIFNLNQVLGGHESIEITLENQTISGIPILAVNDNVQVSKELIVT